MNRKLILTLMLLLCALAAGSYETTFLKTSSDPSGANIAYTGGGDIVGPLMYLLVKEAKGWNGTEDLILSGFWPNQGAISHVSLYGASTPVPEPATMLLLGVGLVGLAGFGRKRFIKR